MDDDIEQEKADAQAWRNRFMKRVTLTDGAEATIIKIIGGYEGALTPPDGETVIVARGRRLSYIHYALADAVSEHERSHA